MRRPVLHLAGAAALALVLAAAVSAAPAGSDVRVSTHDLIASYANAWNVS